MNKYINVEIKSLKPYKNNAKKHNEKQIQQVMNSIKEFGFINPVIIDAEHNIIAGHCRVISAQKLGYETVPCLLVDHLTDAQKRAYVLADNKLTENGEWDEQLLKIELASLAEMDFDVSLTGFDFTTDYSTDIYEEEYEEEKEYGAERQRTNEAYNLQLLGWSNFTNDFWQMPIIENDGYIPDSLTGFNYAKTSEDKDTTIHFFIDDYQFERVWNDPEKYVAILSEYKAILSPDFSLYMDMPMPMKIWNVYRSRQIGSFYQSMGIKVIPTLQWAERETFEFCFKGIPQGSVVAVSTIGVKRDEEALKVWKAGMEEMLRQIDPSAVIVYGGQLEFDYGDRQVIYFNNQVTENWKNREVIENG